MRILDRSLFHQSELPALLAAIVGFGILALPIRGLAQDSTGSTQGAAQTTSGPATLPPQRKKVELPDGDGKAIAEKSCQACHELSNLTHASKSLEDWRATVQMMIDNGADVPMDKVDILANYLAKNFGPKNDSPVQNSAGSSDHSANSTNNSPASAAHADQAGLPEGDGKEIATASCQSCHKLTNITGAHMSLEKWRDTVKLMMDRGAEIPPDKVDTLVEYLAKNFGPMDASPQGGPASTVPAKAH